MNLRPLVACLLAAPALLAFDGTAFADERVALSYKAPSQCPDAEAFRSKVAARLGYDPVDGTAPRSLAVTVAPAGKGWVATTRLSSPGKPDSQRKLQDADCGALVETVAAAVATVVDPAAAVRPHEARREPARAPVEGAPENADDAAPSAGTGIPLHLEGNWDGAFLFRDRGTSVGYGNGVSVMARHFEKVCKLPCDAVIDRNGTYIVDGPSGIAVTFDPPAKARSLDLRVSPAPAWPKYLGATMGLLGGTGLLVGGVLLPVGLTSESSAKSGMTQFGVGSLLVGGALLAGGIYLAYGTPTTHIDQTDGTRLADREKKGRFSLTPAGVTF